MGTVLVVEDRNSNLRLGIEGSNCMMSSEPGGPTVKSIQIKIDLSPPFPTITVNPAL